MPQDLWNEGIYGYDVPGSTPSEADVEYAPPPSSCSKWAYTTDKGTGSGYCCYCAGFFPCFNCQYLKTHKRWEWLC